jgi:hypothetical protein
MKGHIMSNTLAILSSGFVSLAPDAGAISLGSGPNTFGLDVAFLETHADVLLLRQGSAAIVVVPQWQGRVMTSTADGDTGASNGWINYELIRTKRQEKHIHAFGGEERMWFGPEGGQFSPFFEPKTDFTFENWRVPAPIDTDAFEVIEKTDLRIAMAHEFSLRNWSGTEFLARAERVVQLLDAEDVAKDLGFEMPPEARAVAYQTMNTLINRGSEPWKKNTGLLSIWMLGMLKHGTKTTVFIPLAPGDGPAVNTDYFGDIPSDRLKVEEKIVYYRGDGAYRGKIGIPPARSRHIAASYDPDAGRVTIIVCKPPAPGYVGYVNSSWKIQKNPFSGDAINSYNDGPLQNGDQLGPFYELESSSPARELGPSKSMTHTQITLHVFGRAEELSAVTQAIAGLTTDQIVSALP